MELFSARTARACVEANNKAYLKFQRKKLMKDIKREIESTIKDRRTSFTFTQYRLFDTDDAAIYVANKLIKKGYSVRVYMKYADTCAIDISWKE